MKSAIVLAAGKGTRMKSSINKVMHEVLGKPMIGHVISRLERLKVDNIVVVVGHQSDQIESYLQQRVTYAMQQPQLGTGHAVMQAQELKDVGGQTLILYGDCPLVQIETMSKLFEVNQGKALTVLTAILDDPGQYGRIVRDELGNVVKIVEFKDCNDQQRNIKEINTGIYCVDNDLLFKHLNDISNDNVQNEYYITDLIEIFSHNGYDIQGLPVSDVNEVMGINDRIDLAKATAWLQNRINTELMKNGVTFIDPTSTYIEEDVVIGEDTILYPNVYVQKGSVIGKSNTILPQTFIVSSIIGNFNTIDSSRITDSRIHDYVKVGPFAHLRNGTVVESKNRIGNFVEFKNSCIGFDSRCAHLTYIGDADIGSKVNLGCGVVTVNYDGKNKFKTIVKDGAFIGSNVNLIAPITIGKDAVVAAGTTANMDVEDGEMAIGRARQENKVNYGFKYKNK
ncbi:MAG: bifunctional UDP-N-acetylglucosamine diphosphorylase/glucosamine-1-phosphate N-acetyltransferase GlmU [Firmicutes bacterium HGW-Firmicutes-20]|jgi:bifunctional UDP-N-acetylglucosamine pyrophosphorylase/glucosamine-1-phosphate N-acetyltransferase|nr:MAG: bifunctional UDP-N-acetylglucosamine diphosphorylase/glucosamine-1-phosphate N-acetyltransferase GlmU [Firmicutes bacterium HGW-Firmicutes-20]PKM88111.1 MAG: bifunctional UDP-N-acetylglucosamine diphosphorylase/glucosamine-1-phosphate N-acetyltransferase GlmU [Firmicutes bacterium HGW-Firmicutes-10]